MTRLPPHAKLPPRTFWDDWQVVFWLGVVPGAVTAFALYGLVMAVLAVWRWL